jgi:hypothetical protein
VSGVPLTDANNYASPLLRHATGINIKKEKYGNMNYLRKIQMEIENSKELIAT